MKKMKKYKIEFQDIVNKSVIIKAKNKEQARKIFFNWNFDDDEIEEGDMFLNDNINIIEVIK